MSGKLNIDLSYRYEQDPDNIHVIIHLIDEALLGRQVEFRLRSEVKVHDSAPVHGGDVVFSRKLRLTSKTTELTIPKKNVTGRES
ncbi:MAG: hypothetical protein KDD70_04865 [Bdellovibrionales bacterium]|nr:hypothetical protein [Bdellovibrionales bacterium]